MAITFPTSLDSLTNPNTTDALSSPSHAGQHSDANDAIEALEAKLGANSSAVTTSHDYKLGEVTGSDKAVGKTANQVLTNKTISGASNTLTVREADLSLTDVTTGNSSTSNHGFLKKLDNTATDFMDGTGNWDSVKDSDLSLSDITTNDVSTSKHGFVPKAPNDTTKFLRGDGSWQVPSSTVIPRCRMGTCFETTGRFTSLTSGGTNTFDTSGLSADTTSTTTRCAGVQALSNGTNMSVFSGSPSFSASFMCGNIGTTGSYFVGMGNVTVGGTGHTFTNNHIGFKVTVSGSTATLFATQADGTTENASSALTTITNTDWLDVIAIVNSTTSVDYYWRKNGGALSSATNLTSNLPTTATNRWLQASVSNNSTATQQTLNINSASYER